MIHQLYQVKLINMKKIIFKVMAAAVGFLLLFGYCRAQTSQPSAKSKSTIKKNQVTITVKKDDEKGWKQLFNGKDLSGWKHVGKGDMLVEDGLIHGKGGMGLLYYPKQKFANC